MHDREAIKSVVDGWLSASATGDVDKVLGLMTDDAIFLVAGQRPFGKEQFAASSRAMKEKGMRVEARSEIQEIEVAGDCAWCRTELHVTITLPDGEAVRRSGATLTIFRRSASGWLIARDANLLALETNT